MALKLDERVGSCNTLNDLSDKECVPIETEDLTLSAYRKHDYRNKWIEDVNKAYIIQMNGIKCNSNQDWNNDKCWREYKNIIYVKKIIYVILLHVVAKTITI